MKICVQVEHNSEYRERFLFVRNFFKKVKSSVEDFNAFLFFIMKLHLKNRNNLVYITRTNFMNIELTELRSG